MSMQSPLPFFSPDSATAPSLPGWGFPVVLCRAVSTIYAPDRCPGDPFPAGLTVWILCTSNVNGSHVVTDWRGRVANVPGSDVVYLHPNPNPGRTG